MATVMLVRLQESDQGTFGLLVTPGFQCYSLELPWHQNQRRISCIPTGDYQCTPEIHRRFGRIYRLQGVQGRAGILIHSGNYAGDKSVGLRSHSEGCILLGLKQGVLDGQKAILQSRFAMADFLHFMDFKPFLLSIRDYKNEWTYS